MFYEVEFEGFVSEAFSFDIKPMTVEAYTNEGYTIDSETFKKYDLSDCLIKFNDELIYAYSKNPMSLHILEETSMIYGLKKPPLFGEAALI